MKSKNFDDYLNDIDNSLSDKRPKEKVLIYIMVVSLLFAVSYLLFWESSKKSYTKKLKYIKNYKEKVSKDKMFLKYNNQKVVFSLENKLKDIEKGLIETKDKNLYVENKIAGFSSLLYNEKIWGNYINSIDKKAKKNNIKITKLSNKYNLSNDNFGHILDIDIKSEGQYQNIVNFINSLEESKLIVDVHDYKIESNEILENDINLSIWGIKN